MTPFRQLILAALAGGALATVHPPCRKSAEYHLLKWPQGEQGLIVFGGKGFDWTETKKGKEKKQVEFFGDTWSFDSSSRGWTAIAAGAGDMHPGKRWKPASTSYYNNSGMILFGGCSSPEADGVLNDLWVLKPTDLGKAEWLRLYTIGAPVARRGHVVAANSTHLIVAGGKGWDVRLQKVTVHKDLWAIPLSLLDSTTSAALPSMNLDSVLWPKGTESHASQSQWTQGQSFPGEVRWGATGHVVQGADGKEYLAYFGGRNYNDDPNRKGKYIYYNDLWLYDLQNDAWTLAHPGGPGEDVPHPRDHHGAASIDGNLYVFGGRVIDTRDADAVLNDLWMFSCATNSWTLVQGGGPSAPSPRFMPGVATALWAGREVISVYGGETFPGSTKQTSMNDVWMYAPDVVNGSGSWKWHELFASDCSPSDAEGEVVPFFLAASSFQYTGLATGGAILSLVAAFTAVFAKSIQREGAVDEETRGADYAAMS